MLIIILAARQESNKHTLKGKIRVIPTDFSF